MATKKKTKGEVVLLRSNRRPFEWDNTLQVCSLLQQEISQAMRAGVKLNKMAEDTKLVALTISNIGYGITKQPRSNTLISLLKYFNYKITIS